MKFELFIDIDLKVKFYDGKFSIINSIPNQINDFGVIRRPFAVSFGEW